MVVVVIKIYLFKLLWFGNEQDNWFICHLLKMYTFIPLYSIDKEYSVVLLVELRCLTQILVLLLTLFTQDFSKCVVDWKFLIVTFHYSTTLIQCLIYVLDRPMLTAKPTCNIFLISFFSVFIYSRVLPFSGTPWSHSHSYTFTPGSRPVQWRAHLWPLNSSTGATGVRGLAQGPSEVQ